MKLEDYKQDKNTRYKDKASYLKKIANILTVDAFRSFTTRRKGQTVTVRQTDRQTEMTDKPASLHLPSIHIDVSKDQH